MIMLVIVAFALGVLYTLQHSKSSTPTIVSPNLSITGVESRAEPEVVEGKETEEGVALYFTKAGCTSLPYISVLSGAGEERTSTTNISANDGYTYAVIDGTRSIRTIVSRFDGACTDTAPEQLDTFQVLDVGVTQTTPN